jgi:hypothetical protein
MIIIEAFIIGCFFLILYLFFSLIIDNFIIAFFLAGFFKHYLGYLLGIQTFYCNYYDYNNYNNDNYVSQPHNIYLESIMEGLLFAYLALLFTKIISNNYILAFIIGFIVHIIADYIGLHALFFKYNCIVKK